MSLRRQPEQSEPDRVSSDVSKAPDPTRDALREAFDPERFRREGHAIVERLADHLAAMDRRQGPVLPPQDPRDAVRHWSDALENGTMKSTEVFLESVIARSNHQHHPRCVGHQVSAPLPSAALIDAVGAVMNNGMAVYETGPASTPIEIAVVRWLAARIGWDRHADGILTSGGSLGNLTALLAARQARAGHDVWTDGSSGDALAVVVSEQAHYCVSRAVKVMGWGAAGVVTARVDQEFRMRAGAVDEAISRAEQAGRRVVAVVASACTTATGTFDPIDEIADLCERRGLWLHVDGAHGASAVLSPRHRGLVRGIERADSVVWDAHKMLLVPGLVTAVLFRDGDRAYESFAQQASYLFGSGDPRDEWFNLGLRTMECTKRMMSLQLYGAIAKLGHAGLGGYVASVFDLAARFAARIRETPGFELAIEPDCNIVCFRHVPEGMSGAALDAHQSKLRRRILEDASFYLVQTRLPAGVYLRTTLMNPRTTLGDLEALLEAIVDASSTP